MNRKERRQLAKLQGRAMAEQIQKGNGAQGGTIQFAALRTEVYQGLVPPAEQAERYEALHPGCTDRFMSMAERQMAQRHHLERTFLHYNGVSQLMGTVIAGLVVLSGIGVGGFLIYSGKSVQGFGAMIATLGPVAVLFLVQRRTQSAEVEEKRKKAG